ncbi:MAG: M23 family metallopeptidase [Hyphomicrobium sp.]
MSSLPSRAGAGMIGAMILAAVAVSIAPGTVKAQEAPKLSLPLKCEPHKTCFIQSYVDLDPGPGVRDFACGGATYDKHNGVDFRVLSAAAAKTGVAVLAAADGTIKALRDGVTDIFLRDSKSDAIKGRECGNGVVIDHGGGWETQYCHLKQGTIAVTNGQAVQRGTRLGDVGYSGMADFAHVHLTVRRNGTVVDPFLPDAASPDACVRNGAGHGLWQPEAIAPFAYRNGEIIGAGFTGAVPNLDTLETDHTAIAALSVDSPALLVFARFVNLLQGDRVRIVIDGPGGPLVEQLSEPIERNKAVFISYAGKKRRELPWAVGRYQGRVELVRDGGVIAASVAEYVMPSRATP